METLTSDPLAGVIDQALQEIEEIKRQAEEKEREEEKRRITRETAIRHSLLHAQEALKNALTSPSFKKLMGGSWPNSHSIQYGATGSAVLSLHQEGANGEKRHIGIVRNGGTFSIKIMEDSTNNLGLRLLSTEDLGHLSEGFENAASLLENQGTLVRQVVFALNGEKNLL